mgnify:CR=1 FL=1
MSGESTASEDPAEMQRVRRALREIRREGWKVAVIYAIVDATLATLLANLLVTVLGGVPGLPARVPIPEAVRRALRETVGITLAEPTVSSAAVVGVAIGCLVFGADVALRVRRPLVEQFEAANPELAESLRTARDAVRADRHSRMARRLYEGVLDDLKQSSSIGLLDLRRITVSVLLITALSVGTIQLAVVDLSIAGLGPQPGATAPDGGTDTEYGGLQDGSSILGEPEDVPEGEEDLDTTIDTSGSGSGGGTDASATAYEDSGFAGADTVESQRAGYTESEQLEDAELIREYNLRIREETDDE